MSFVPDISAITRAWLIADDGVYAAASGGVSTTVQRPAGPQIVITPPQVEARSHAGRQVDGVWDARVLLWAYAPRQESGSSDLPDLAAAQAIVEAVGVAAAAIQRAPWVDQSGFQIDIATVQPLTQGQVDPTTGEARSLIGLQLTLRS